MNHPSDAAVHFTSSAPAVRAVVHGFQILLLGYTYALRLHVPILERCESRKPLSRLAGSFVAKLLGDESSANGHEWVRRDAHAAKPAGSREVTQVSTAASPNPNLRRH
mgnify:CR=1 FL=1